MSIIIDHLGRIASFGGNTAIFPQSYLLKDLVSYWKLDETDGSAYDSKGNNNLAVNASQNLVGKINNSYRFNTLDNSSYLLFSSSPTESQSELTISMWIKPDDVSEWRTIWYEANNQWYIQYFITQGFWWTRDICTGAIGARNSDLYYDSLRLNVSAWNHLAFVYSVKDKYKRMYLNGVLEASIYQPLLAPLITGNRTYLDMCMNTEDYPGYDEGFKGYLDEVGVWHRSLASNEITELYNNGIGKSQPFSDLTSPSVLSDGSTWGWYEYDNLTKVEDASNRISLWRSQLNTGITFWALPAEYPTLTSSGIDFSTNTMFRSNDVSIAQPFYTYAVIKIVDPVYMATIFRNRITPLFFVRQYETYMRFFAGGNFSDINYTAREYQVMRVLYNGASSKMYWGDTVSSTIDGGTSGINIVELSHSSSGNKFQLKELIYRTAADSIGTQNTICSYLRRKYSIPAPEMIYNGGFDTSVGWTYGSSYVISDGICNKVGVGGNADLDASLLYPFEPGTSYVLSLDSSISGPYSPISIALVLNYGSAFGYYDVSTGHYDIPFTTPSGTNHTYCRIVTGYGYLTLDNISLKKT